jgi:lysophospholipase L1-like esterase
MSRATSRDSSHLALVGLSIIAATVTIAAVELASWLYLSRHPPSQEDVKAAAGRLKGDFVASALNAMKASRASPEIAKLLNPVPLVPDADLLWRTEPLVDRTLPINPRPYRTDETWSLHTDAHGFRKPEPELPGKPAHTFRILCIGDSITFGFNVDEPAAYPNQLARLLRERYPSKHFEVVNAGVPGWSWRQGLRFLEIDGLALAPDLVVIGHGTNDQFFPASTTDSERLGQTYSRPRSLWRHLLLAVSQTNTAQLLGRLFPPAAPTPSPACLRQMRDSGSCRRVSLPEIEQSVEALHALTEKKGIGLLLLNVDFQGTAAAQPLRRAAQRDDIPLLDMVVRFAELRDAEQAARAAHLGLAPRESSAADDDEPREVLLRVAVPYPGKVSVEGSAYIIGSFDVAQPMFDDGTHGDEVAGDSVWSTTIAVPPGVPILGYQYLLDGALEFTPLPPLPAAVAVRTLHVDGRVRGPVERFGRRLLMAEQTHPNAAGQRRIAAEIMTALPQLPSFARFAGAAPAGSDSH